MKNKKIPAQFQALLWNQAICNWFDGKPDDLARFIENGWELNEIQRNSIGKILRGEVKLNAKSNAKNKVPTWALCRLQSIAARKIDKDTKPKKPLSAIKPSVLAALELFSKQSDISLAEAKSLYLGPPESFESELIEGLSNATGKTVATLKNKLAKPHAQMKRNIDDQKEKERDEHLKKYSPIREK